MRLGVKAIQHKKRKNNGILGPNARIAFTLIELMIVLFLMAIAIGLLIPSAAPQTEQQLRAAAHLIASEIELARDLAITYNSQYQLAFETNANRVVLFSKGENGVLNQLPKDIVNNSTSDPTHRITDLSTIPGLWGQIQIAACAQVSNTLIPTAEVVFDPTGIPESGKSFLVWLKAGNSTSARYITVVFDRSTGQVYIGSMSGMPPPF